MWLLVGVMKLSERKDDRSDAALDERERREAERQARLLFDVDDEILMEWSVHPMSTRQRTTTRMFILIAIAYIGAYILFGAWGVVLSMVFTILPGATYILPTRYVLTRKGIRLMNTIARDKNRWTEFTSYEVYPDAVQLYFNRRTVRGWVLRGNVLFIDDDEEELRSEVVDIISRYLPREGSENDTSSVDPS